MHSVCRMATAIVLLTVATSASGTAVARSGGTGGVVEVPPSIDATGATDVSSALSAFLASLPAATTVRFPNPATYRIDAGLELRGIDDLTVEGQGATLVAPDDGAAAEPPSRPQRRDWPRSRRLVTIADSSNVVIRGLSVQGPNADAAEQPELEAQAGFFVAQSSDVSLDGVAVRAVWGDGVTVVGASRNIAITNSVFDGIGRQGIAVTNASDVIVSSNRFDRVARSVFDVEPVRAWRVERASFRDNTIGDYENFVLAAVGGGPNVTDIELRGNRIEGGRGLTVFAGFVKQTRRGLTIADNSSTVAAVPALGDTPLQIVNYDDVAISGNRGAVAGNRAAIALNAVCNATIADNEWPGAAREVVEVAECGATPDTTPLLEDGASPPPTGATTTTAAASGAGGDATTDSSDSLPLWLAVAILMLLAVVVGVAVLRTRRRLTPDTDSPSPPPPLA